MPHDACQYYGHRYDLPAVPAISLGYVQTPSPDKIKELQTVVRDFGVTCVLNDPQTQVDPMGTTVPLGPDRYAQTLHEMADAYAACLNLN